MFPEEEEENRYIKMGEDLKDHESGSYFVWQKVPFFFSLPLAKVREKEKQESFSHVTYEVFHCNSTRQLQKKRGAEKRG